MKRWLIAAALAGSALAAFGAQAQTGAANPFVTDKWQFRPLILITPDAQSAAYRELRDQIEHTQAQFDDREMLLYTVEDGEGTRRGKPMTAYETRALLDALDVDPNQGVTVILVGKDGGKKIEQRGAVDLEQIYDSIDRMPMRRADDES